MKQRLIFLKVSISQSLCHKWNNRFEIIVNWVIRERSLHFHVRQRKCSTRSFYLSTESNVGSIGFILHAVNHCRTGADGSAATLWYHFSTKGIRKVLHLQATLTVNCRVKDHIYQNMTLVQSHFRGPKAHECGPRAYSQPLKADMRPRWGSRKEGRGGQITQQLSHSWR